LQDWIEELLLEGDMRSGYPIDVLTAGFCRQKVADTEMFGDLVESAS
jgi:hypothetical protein